MPALSGWNGVGYHNPEVNTPTIDALAKGGPQGQKSPRGGEAVLLDCSPRARP